jgi:hypothetical protein
MCDVFWRIDPRERAEIAAALVGQKVLTS